MARSVVRFNLDDVSEIDGLVADFTNNNSATFTTGKNGNAVHFDDASSQSLSTTDTWYHGLTGFSFHMVGWIYLDNGGQNHGLFGQTTASYHCHVISTDKVRFRVNLVSVGALSIDSAAISTTTWVHVSAGYDHGAGHIFLSLNRASNSTSSTGGAAIATSSANFHMGSISGGNYMDGLIDGFMMCKEGLFTTDELDDHYNAGAGAEFTSGIAPGTIALIKRKFMWS